MKDVDGQTPLMVATLYGQTKIVRRLLMKGAKRHIKNNDGKLPIDIAIESEYKNITKMLNDDYSCLDFLKFYYNVKLEYKPKDRNLQIPMVFIITTLCSIFILNGVLIASHDWMYIVEGVIFALMFILYLTLLRKPKKQPKGEITKFINDTRKVCLECVKRKPKRSYHCDICKTCI